MSREEPYYIPIPEEYGRRKLNALYREIPLKDTASRLLRKYLNAAANLYGIIPLSKLYGIITSQNKIAGDEGRISCLCRKSQGMSARTTTSSVNLNSITTVLKPS